MKKVIVILFLISISQLLNAQEDVLDNKYFIGGTFRFQIQNNNAPVTRLPLSLPGGISSSSYSEFRSTSFSFTPYVAKELTPKLFIGANLGYSFAQQKSNILTIGSPSYNFKTNTNQIAFGLFFRQIVNPQNALRFYVQPFVGYNIVNENTYVEGNLSEARDINFYEVGAKIGLMYDLTKNFRTTIQSSVFSYTGGNWKLSKDNISHQFSLFNTYLNLSSFGLGFEYRW